MKSIGHAYAWNCECSLQEAVYQVTLELWLKTALFQENVFD